MYIDGKNNGSVKGVTYFDCSMNFGMFVNPKTVSPYLVSSSIFAVVVYVNVYSSRRMLKNMVFCKRNLDSWAGGDGSGQC